MRKLATFSIALSAAVFFAHYILPEKSCLWLAGCCVAFSLLSLLFKGDKRLRIILICSGMAFGFAASGISYLVKTVPSRELSGETMTFAAEVKEYPYVSENFSSVTVSLRDSALPRAGATVYFFDKDMPELRPGDRISMTASLKYAGERYGEDWDGNISDNVYLLCYPKGEVRVTGRSPWSFLYFPQDIEKKIIETALKVFPESSSAFMTALLTGDKHLLYEDTELYAAMSAAGVLHVVAVSGMHVAFLVGFLHIVLRKKKLYSLIGLPAIWIFAAVAGGTPSVIRAAFMQSSVLVAPLLKRENDGLTSLTSILAVLLIINPAACTSVSLQLSFSAMLGMIFITPKIDKGLTRQLKAKRKAGRGAKGMLPRLGYKLLFAVIASFAATVGAIAFSTPIMAVYFGTVSVYTVIVNILVFWAISLCFISGYLICFLGMLWLPLGIAGGFAVNLLTKYITAVVNTAASLPYARVFVGEGVFRYWLIFAYAVFIIWYLLRRGKSFRPVIPTALVVSALCVGIIVTEAPAPASFTAVDVGQGQSLIISSGDGTAVIDCGGKSKGKNAGDITAAELLSSGIRTVDVLCITHFDDDHINGVLRLMSQVKVKCLVAAPEYEADTDRDAIMALADKQGVEVYIIQDSAEISAGGVSLTAFAPVSKTKPELIYLISADGCDILVTGDADSEIEKRLLLSRELPDIEIFVAGHHGSKYSSCEELLEAISAETAVISSGYNSYGHPAEETLRRFDEAGMAVLRTDTQGSVRISLEG